MYYFLSKKNAEGKILQKPKFYCIDDYVTAAEMHQEGNGKVEPTI